MKILLAEDEKELSRALVAVLTHEGFSVDAVYDGEEAVEKAKTGVYNCMIFDIMMPKLDGVSALKNLRAMGNVTPALFLTAKSEVDDRVVGLDAGADDYLAKPFSMKELIARINSMMRRVNKYMPKQISVGSVVLDTEEQSISSENSIGLAKKETKLMELFMLNVDKALSTKELFNNVWREEDNANEDVVWVYVSFLRDKLRAIDANIQIEGEEGGDFTLKIIS